MRRLFLLLAAAFCLLAAGARASAQVPVLYYDFENNTTRTTFENAVEQSVNSGSAALTRSAGRTISNVAGAGTNSAGQAITTSAWQSVATDPGNSASEYFQFTVNTGGFSQISVTFDNQASNTGPAAVGLMYSTDGTNFTAVSPVPTGNNVFSTAVFDLSGVSAIDNQSSVTIRLYAYAGDRTGRLGFTSGGTFRIDNLTVRARTVTASKTLLDYPSIGLSTTGGALFTPFYSDLVVNGSGITVTLNGELKLLTGTLTITSGTLDQGASSNLTAGTISIAAAGTLKNTGTGDLTVGAGGVFNDGTINFDGGGASCTDDILIRSTIPTTQRTWSGAGAFSFIDVDVQDQKAAGAPSFPVLIIAVSSTDSGRNNNWTFTSDPTCASGTYTWVGGSGNDWQSPASWSPARLVAGASDVLVFDGNVTPAPTAVNVPTQTIATLKLVNSAAVTLNAASLNAPQTLTLSTSLLVPAGSSLTLSGTSALRLNVANGASGTVGGGMAFEGGAHRLLANAASAVTFQSGAVFDTDTGFGGNPFGTGASGDGAANSIVFANGSFYLHKAGESPFGSAGSGPVVVFQTGSTATWLTSSGFQASGRTYADLSVGREDPGGVAVSLSDTGSGDFQFDNLTVNSTASANSSLQFTGTGTSTVYVRGNVTSKGAGLGSIPDVILGGGSGGIVISKPGGGTVTFGTSGNTRSVDFESGATVASGTTLSLGRVLVAGLNASSNYVVTVEDGGGLDGSAGGYVIGKLRRQLSGTGASVFQVGSANGYSPVTLNITSNSNNTPAPFTVSAAASYMTGLVSQAAALRRTYTLTSAAPDGSLTADITFQYVSAPTASGGDVSADVVENTLNAFRREAGDALTEFAANARGANTVTVGGVKSFSEWALANARPCALVVNTTADPSGASGTVSLREAVRDICAGGTVSFDLPADSLITLGSEIALARNISIVGPSNRLTLSGGGAARVFNVNSGAAAYVSDLNLTGGSAASGGAVENSGTLTLVGVSLYGNTATDGGGAVRNDGTLALVNSTLSGNGATSATSDGGALLNAAGKTATLLNVTVTDNTAGRDGNGIHNSGTLILKNSLVAGNGSSGVDLYDAGTTNATGSITSGAPGLSALAFRGGPTRTHVPLPGSAAVGGGADATALDDDVDDSQTTVNVSDAAAIPVGLLIRVGDEQMLVTAKNSNALTVTRAANGTNAAAHDGGAAVNPAFDQRGLPRLVNTTPDIGAVEANYAINATAGTPQSVTLGTLFPALLKATVTESGSPVGDLSVTFDAPAVGASGTFQSTGTNSADAPTDSDGLATAPAFSANAVPGGYNVTAGLAGGVPSVNFGLTNLKLGQNITFDTLPGKTFGDADFQLSASASSNLAVAFTASGDCTSSGSTVHLTGAGSCTVTASQPGDASYDAAQDVSRTFSIAKAAQTITFGTLAGKTFGDAAFTVGATGGASGNSVTFGSTTPDFCSVSGSTVTILAAGACTVRASQAGNANYEAAQDVDRSFQIAKAATTTTVNCSGGLIYNGSTQTPCIATATGAGGLSQSLTVIYTDNTNAGTASAAASFAGDDNHTGSNDSKTFQIAKASSTTAVTCAGGNVYNGSPLTPCAAAVTGAGGLNTSAQVSYADNTGAGTATASASYAGDDNHEASSDSKQFSIARAASTVTLTCPAGVTYDGSAQTPCSASVSGAGGLSQTLTVNYLNNVNAGTATASASYGGDANHNDSDGSQTFSIGKAGSTTAVVVSDAVYDGQPHGATATATGAGGLSQPLTVTYTGRNGTNYPASPNAPTNAGEYTATANFADGNHTGNSDSKDFRIGKAAQAITFGALADRTFGDADVALSATASSNLGVSFAASGNCTLTAGGAIRITGAGSCTVTASQGGDGNYEAAAGVQRSFQIAKASTVTAVSSAPNPAGAGQLVTLTATVTSAAGVPTGLVTFRDGAGALACSNAGGQTLGGGVATCTTSALGAGGHALTAEYTGDANFLASTGSLSGVQTVGGAFEFSQAVYAGAERGGSVAVTVRRTGDTGSAASVDYSTDDGSAPSVAVACSATTGLALERCDYTRAAGTLQFAANEAEKTFVVLVNDDSYFEGTETTQLRLSNPSTGAVLGVLNTAALEITDDAAESEANVIDDDEAFVRQHYHDFLNREPDASGLKFWTDGIKECGADAGCREVKRVHTSAAFFLSIEFQQTGYFAYRVHKAAFGDLASDRPVPVALRDFLRDTQRLGQGVVVGQGDWQAQLEANRQAYAVEFVRRPEFLARHQPGMSASEFVGRLDDDAGGVLTEAEKAPLVVELSANPSDATLRADVLMRVADSPTLVSREKNRAFVLMQYIGYLRRNPSDAPEAGLDFAGYNFWLSKLEQFGGDFVGAEMVKAFINSVEYRGRFGR
jgi:hypothetical protein